MTNLQRFVTLGFAALSVLGTGCGNAGGAPVRHVAAIDSSGSAEGDVFLVMKNGDTKKGAGRTILLVRNSDSLQAQIGAACDRVKPAMAATSRRIKAITDSIIALPTFVDLFTRHSDEAIAALGVEEHAMRDSVDAALGRFVADTTGTGIAAHYRFTKIRPGSYLLVGSWKIGNNDYRWVAPIKITGAQAMHRDLDNSTEASQKLYCGIAS
jgi:hypothetical protein